MKDYIQSEISKNSIIKGVLWGADLFLNKEKANGDPF